MSSVQYPFIDIVVLEGVRDQFLAGSALVLFSRDMKDVLWANGPGAALFGASNVYDLMEQGVAPNDLTLRQLRASAGALKAVGSPRSVTIRTVSGFDRIAAQAKIELIHLPDAQHGVLLSLEQDKPAAKSDPARILDGLQDPNTHIALLSESGALLAASEDFIRLHLYSRDRYTILRMLDKSGERLRKHKVPSQFGFLPGAVAKLSDKPGIYLLFVVQPQQDDMVGASTVVDEAPTPADTDTTPVESAIQTATDSAEIEPVAVAEGRADDKNHSQDSEYNEALTAISEISEVEEQVEEDPDFTLSGEPEPVVPEQESEPELETASNNEAPTPAHNETSYATEKAPGESYSLMTRRETRTTRFVWKIDADGNFSEISPELAAAVGPHAAEIAGLSFGDVAALFNLDPEGRITELLNRRDTWSGKTIWWPLEGTSLTVPIDLAALPTYSRSREFDGFRGFGIIRLADAQEDPLALGLTLVSSEDGEDIAANNSAHEFLTFADDDAVEQMEDEQASIAEITSDHLPDADPADAPHQDHEESPAYEANQQDVAASSAILAADVVEHTAGEDVSPTGTCPAEETPADDAETGIEEPKRSIQQETASHTDEDTAPGELASFLPQSEDIDTAQVEPVEPEVSHAEAEQAQTAQEHTAQTQAEDAEAEIEQAELAQPEVIQAEAEQVQTAQEDIAQTQAKDAEAEVEQAELAQPKVVQAEAEQVQTAQEDIAQTQAEDAEAEVKQAELVQPEVIQAQAEQVQTAQEDTGLTQAEDAEAEQAEPFEPEMSQAEVEQFQTPREDLAQSETEGDEAETPQGAPQTDEAQPVDATLACAESFDEEPLDPDLAVGPEEVEAFYAELETLESEGGGLPLIDMMSEDEASRNLQPPAVEKPVLRIVDNPNQRYSDKVIRFDERRARNGDMLSPGEQAAFQEIARRLEAFRRGEEAERAEKQAAEKNGKLNTGDAPSIEPATEVSSTPQAPAPEESQPRKHGSLLDAARAGENEQPLPSPAVTEDTEPAAAEDDEDRITLAEAYAQAASLRPRPELSAEIIDQMPVALLVHSGDDLIHANAEFLRLTGYGNLDELVEVGGLDALLQRHELDDKATEAGGMVVVRADDVIVPVTARLQSVRYEGATALILALMPAQTTPLALETVAAVAQMPASVTPAPITTEQAGEIARMGVEIDELRAILDTATDGVVTLGAEGDIRSMNRAASALFNYDNADTLGKPFVMLFAHESQKSVLDYLSGLTGFGVASLLNDGREVIGRESGGGFVPLFMTIGKLTSSNGFCAVIRDITQWKRTEDELRSAKRAAETANAHKSEFLAHVSHEIRTPLNAIIGFADMMATERLGPIGHSRYIEYANDIGRSGRHVLDIVNDLLDISKIEAGEMDLDFDSVGLNETIAESVSILQPQANTQRVIIRTALNQSVPPVVADLRSIKQIVLNILSNAIRFTPSGGQIVVSTSYETNGSVVLRVRDTGIGMTRSELELAMKPFRQVAGASRKRGDGTGLGLPLTKAMVDANRAVFSIHSAPNEGTLVEVTFPSPRVLAK